MSKEAFPHGDILFKIKDDIHPCAKEQFLCTRDYVVYKNAMLPCKLQTNFIASEACLAAQEQSLSILSTGAAILGRGWEKFLLSPFKY